MKEYFQQIPQVQKFDPPLSLAGDLQRKLSGIGGEAEANRVAAAGQGQLMHPARQPVCDHRQAPLSPLADQGDIAPVPAQRG